MTDLNREHLAAVADFLIPGTADFPSATAAGVADTLIDRVLGFRPDLAGEFAMALSLLDLDDIEDSIDRLVGSEPTLFEALTTLISGAYFQSPDVQTALNYKPAPRPAHDDVDTYIDLLEGVVERGFDIHGADLV